MTADLLRAIEELPQPDVLVVGDPILDRYVSGTVERIHSQEASLDKVFTNVTGHRLDQAEPVAVQ